MQQLFVCGIYIIDLILCLAFFDCFLTRFPKVRRWEMYLSGVVLGILQFCLFQTADSGIEKLVFYILSHTLAGILFVDAFRVVWLYFIWYALVRIIVFLGISGITDFLLPSGRTEAFTILTALIGAAIQALFVYYVHFYKKNYIDKGMKLHRNTILLPLLSLGLLFAFLYWQSLRGIFDYGVCYFLLFVIITVNLLYYFLVERVELSYEMVLRRNEYEQKNQNYQEQYYKHLESQQQEIRAIRHDIKNQLIGILGEINAGDIVRARSEMERILKQIEQTEQIFYTANPGMNAVLNFKH